MARIRTIKPEFFTSEDICGLSAMARLLFISLWCEADRAGRLDWRPGTIKLRYFPADDCDIAEMAGELQEAGLIVVYEVEGKSYAEIPSFNRHQVINNRESESERPPRIDACVTRGDACKRKEGRKEGKEGKGTRANALPPDFKPSDANRELAGKLSVSLEDELGKFVDYHRAKGSKFKDWHSALNNWIRNADKFRREATGDNKPRLREF